MSSMSERKFCKNWVLLSERCRRLQYSLEKTESGINNSRQRRETSRVTEKRAPTSAPETRVPRTRRSWVAATAYLQSRNRRWWFFSIPSFLCCTHHGPECHMFSVLTLELQHHITQVRLDVELIVRRQHQTETRRNRGYTRRLDWIF